ncbi:unnamed protein product [Echinostoma caproni]|uniref:Uncharacterized protein n=1 Tax=Echinostoma caproni TaxID=27848 RepID=A0A183AIQ7_9TREM|nr:unnamed protein product [Echinostoma caproni]
MTRSNTIGQVICTLLLLVSLEQSLVVAVPRRLDPLDRRIYYVAAEPESPDFDWDLPELAHASYKRSHYMSQRLGK